MWQAIIRVLLQKVRRCAKGLITEPGNLLLDKLSAKLTQP
jgi:hypothetical protein